MNLNLGCGADYRPGWVNVDLYADRVDERVDLFKYPWPWPSDSADTVLMSHFLEHQPDPVQCLAECWRILRPSGTVVVRVPHARGIGAYWATHRCFFSHNTFRGYSAGKDAWFWIAYNKAVCWRQRSYSVMFRYGGKLGRAILWRWLEPIANRFPQFWEQFSPVQPDQIEWVGVAVKPSDLEAK